MNTRAASPSAAVIAGGGPVPMFFAEEDRAQRNTVALRDVDYLIQARFRLTERAGPEDNVMKFVEMFNRRVKNGQSYHQPYFGCREFPAQVLGVENAPSPITDSRSIGLMLWDIIFDAKGNRPVFFDARLKDGVLVVPDSAECGGIQ